MAQDARSVRDPRQRSDAAADAGRARAPALPALARALADACGARRRLARGGDPRMAGPRLQPAGDQPAPGRAGDRGARLAGRPHEPAGRRAVHGRGDPEPGLRRAHPPRRHQRGADSAQDRARVRAGVAAGAVRSRRDDLPRPHPALHALPARGAVPVARADVRAAAQAVALRGIVPAAPRGAAAARRGGGSAGRGARRGGSRVAAAGRSRRAGRRARPPRCPRPRRGASSRRSARRACRRRPRRRAWRGSRGTGTRRPRGTASRSTPPSRRPGPSSPSTEARGR